MKIYLIRDADGQIMGYARGNKNWTFDSTNSLYIVYQENEKHIAESVADTLNRPMSTAILPVTVLEIELP